MVRRSLALVATAVVLGGPGTGAAKAVTTAPNWPQSARVGNAWFKAWICRLPDGRGVPLDYATVRQRVWTDFADASEGCAQGAPMDLRLGVPGKFGHLGPTPGAQWEINLPGGLALAGAVARRTIYSENHVADRAATAQWLVSAGYASSYDPWNTGWAVESCVTNQPGCVVGVEANGESRPGNDISWGLRDDNALRLAVRCIGEVTGACWYDGFPRVRARIHSVELVVRDLWVPVPTGLSGTALEDGVQTDERTVVADVSDDGSGLFDVVVEIDGVVAARGTDPSQTKCVDAGQSEHRDFTTVAPCKTGSQRRSFSFDSRKFADGKHRMRITATDAAGNEALLTEREVHFENYGKPVNTVKPSIEGPSGAPRPGDLLRATPGKWDDQGRSIKFTYQWQGSADGVSWDNKPKADSPNYLTSREDIGRYVRVLVTAETIEGSASVPSDRTAAVVSGATIAPAGFGDGNEAPSGAAAGGDPSTAQLVVDREQRTVDVKHGAKIVLTGRLVDADGQPIANASVDVFEQLVLTAAPWNKIGSVTTDSQGGYSFRPQTTASRRLRFAFADKRDSANYRATREVLVSVQGAMSISAKRKVLSPGSTIRLKGRLTVDQLPKSGTWVEVQVLDAGVWRTIATRKTSSKGLWTFKHRLRQSSGITFRFRSRLRPVGDVASAETKSSTLKVRVR